MRTITDHATYPANTLVIMLPGANHQPEGFVEEGFVNAVRARKLPVDLVMAELPFSHIADTSAIDSLHREIIQPAMQGRYKAIWISGISIGGYLAMAYANRFPGVLTGLSLLAPYPGNRITTNEIVAAGGLGTWSPQDIAEDDTERHNWQWLKQFRNEDQNLSIYLGYGQQDRFADSHAMMAEVLSKDKIDAVHGGHVWPVWLALWERFLDKEFALTHLS